MLTCASCEREVDRHGGRGLCHRCYQRTRYAPMFFPLDVAGMREWLPKQRRLHLHQRPIGANRVTWVIVQRRSAVCEDERRCVVVKIT